MQQISKQNQMIVATECIDLSFTCIRNFVGTVPDVSRFQFKAKASDGDAVFKIWYTIELPLLQF